MVHNNEIDKYFYPRFLVKYQPILIYIGTIVSGFDVPEIILTL